MGKTKEQLLSENQQFKNQLVIMRKRFAKYKHDISSPLGTLYGCFSSMDRENNLPDVKEYTQWALEATKKIGKLLDKMFAFEDAVSLNIEDIDCNRLIEEIVRDIQIGNEKAKDVKITWDILPVIRADVLQISRVFQNLIDNAIKFCSDELPTVHISVERKEEDWLFTVADNGIGMTYDEKKAAFDEGIHNKQYKGEGLGLTICREIMKGHGGGIYVESELGEGSTFFVTIPIVE